MLLGMAGGIQLSPRTLSRPVLQMLLAGWEKGQVSVTCFLGRPW